jgi:hypothetical protein
LLFEGGLYVILYQTHDHLTSLFLVTTCELLVPAGRLGAFGRAVL